MLEIDGTALTCGEIAAAARGGEPVRLTAAAWDRVRASYDWADREAQRRPVYGRTTGVGANKSVAVDPTGDPRGLGHARRLLHSHATAAGRLRSAERVRAMLLVRLNQLAAGGSGASPGVVAALEALLRSGETPDVRELVGIGTGDLSALAVVALRLSETVEFAASDALAFLSSSAATIADAALAAADLDELLHAGVAVAALTFGVVDGNIEAFSPAAERATPFPGPVAVCRWMRALVGAEPVPARIQDGFGLRTLPQVQGNALDAVSRLAELVAVLAGSAAENPVALPDLPLAHHGGFAMAPLTTAVASALHAVAQAGQLVQARLAMLMDPAQTGLAAFLADGTPGASGAMSLEYVAAAALGDLRLAATPAGTQSAVLSRGAEDDASFASLAARQALGAVPMLRTLTACELVAALRGVRMKELECRLLADCAELSAETGDRNLTGDIELAENLLPRLADYTMSSSGRSSSA